MGTFINIFDNLCCLSLDITVAIVGIFLISCIGYILGRIEIKGVFLGTAGVFLMALLFGYLCTLDFLQKIPVLNQFYIAGADVEVVLYYKMIETIGLVLFVTSVGFIAGPRFFYDLKINVKSYVFLGLVIVLSGSVICALFACIPGIENSYSTGILSGALTSTPAFAAAKEAVGISGEGMVALGQAVAYPFGVIGAVLFVQLVPKVLKVNIDEERTAMLKTFAKKILKTRKIKEWC